MEKAPSSASSACWSAGLRALGERFTPVRLVLDPIAAACVACTLPPWTSARVRTPDPRPARTLQRSTGSRSFSVPAGGPDLAVLPPARRREPLGGDRRPDAGAAARRVGSGRPQPGPAPGGMQQPGGAYVQWHLEHSIRSLRHVEHVWSRTPVRPPYPHPPGPAPAIPADWCPGTSPWSWTATGAGPSSAGAPHRGSQDGGAAPLRRDQWARIELAFPTCRLRVLHRELARSPDEVRFPDGIQPGRDPPPRGQLNRDGGPGPLGRPRAPGLAQRHHRNSRTPSGMTRATRCSPCNSA